MPNATHAMYETRATNKQTVKASRKGDNMFRLGSPFQMYPGSDTLTLVPG